MSQGRAAGGIGVPGTGGGCVDVGGLNSRVLFLCAGPFRCVVPSCPFERVDGDEVGLSDP